MISAKSKALHQRSKCKALDTPNTWNNWPAGDEVRSRKSEVTVEIRSSFPGIVSSLEDCDLALEEADAAVGQEIHRGRQRDHDQREWRVNECHRNGRDIDDNRD
jgi:hypothetical protein